MKLEPYLFQPLMLVKSPHRTEKLCRVLDAAAPELRIQCTRCGALTEVEGVQQCRGAGHEGRIVIVVRCPKCCASGDVRLYAPKPPVMGYVPRFDGGGIVVEPGGPSYVMATCPCGNAGSQVLLLGLGHGGEFLWLACELRCGHSFALSLRTGTQFEIGEHWHGC